MAANKESYISPFSTRYASEEMQYVFSEKFKFTTWHRLWIALAKAEGIKMLKEAQLDEAVIKLRSLEAFEKVADGKSTKIIIPSEIQSMTGLVSSLSETIKS